MKVKRKQFGFLMTDKERKLLDALAEESGMNAATYLRYLIRQADNDRKTVRISPKKRIAEYV